MELDLKNKVVLISGATGEIGKEICKAFYEEEAIIIPLYRNAEKLQNLKNFLNISGENEFFYPLKWDIHNMEQLSADLKKIYLKHKRLDVIVNSIGEVIEKPFLLLEEEEWNSQIEVNLNSVVRLIRTAVKFMFRTKAGAIINISSIVAYRFGRGISAYAVSKAAVSRITQVLALELGAKNIRVNSVSPGLIDSKMTKNVNNNYGETIKNMIPLQRNGKNTDVAKAVLFLASDTCSSYITGIDLPVDGGFSL